MLEQHFKKLQSWNYDVKLYGKYDVQHLGPLMAINQPMNPQPFTRIYSHTDDHLPAYVIAMTPMFLVSKRSIVQCCSYPVVDCKIPKLCTSMLSKLRGCMTRPG